MKELNLIEIEQVSGGDAETKSWGKQLGNVVGELQQHPEAALMGPVIGAIYLALVD